MNNLLQNPRQAALIGVPSVCHHKLGHVYQVEPNQPHLLALLGNSAQNHCLRFSMTCTHHGTDMYVYSTDPSVVVNRGTFHVEHHLMDDKAAPLYLIFSNLTGIHKVAVETMFRTLDHTFIYNCSSFYVQFSCIARGDHHHELIERFRYKIENNIQHPVMFPLPYLQTNRRSDVWTALQAFITRPNYNFHQLIGSELISNEAFANEFQRVTPYTKRRVATLCFLVEYINSKPETIQRIINLLNKYDERHQPLTPSSAVTAYEYYHGLTLNPAIPSKITGPEQEVQAGHAIPAYSGRRDDPTRSYSPQGTVSDEDHTAVLTRTDEATVFPGRPLQPQYDFSPRPLVIHESVSPAPLPSWSEVRPPQSSRSASQ